MKKSCFITIFVIGICSILILLYLYGTTHILETNPPVLIKKINIGKNNEIKILYIEGNATSQNYIQIRRIDNTTKEEYILGNYERYNYLEKYKFKNDSLTLILKDTSIFHFECVDTFRLNINEIKYKIE
jgi:hypothetical protein